MLMERKRTEDNPRATAAAVTKAIPSIPSYNGIDNNLLASKTDSVSEDDMEYFFGEVNISSPSIYHYLH